MAQTDRVEVITDAARAVVALHPVRLQILELLATPASPSSLSKSLGIPRQHLNYHVRELEAAGLVEMVEEKRKGSVVERIYQATSKQYVVSPKALGGLRATPEDLDDRLSADYLIAVGSKLIEDVVHLRERRAPTAIVSGNRTIPTGVTSHSTRKRQTIPTLALETEIGFASEADRTAFTREVSAAISRIAATYNKEDGEKFRVAIVGHPDVREGSQSAVVEHEPAPAVEDTRDFTTVSRSLLIFASKPNVFDALLNPIRMIHWAGQHVDVGDQVGGAYRIWGTTSYGAPDEGQANGRILELDLPNKLSVQMSFGYGEGVLTWTLEEADYGTNATLECVLPENKTEHTHYLNTDFVEITLYNLRSYIESGEAACQPEYSSRKDTMTVSTKISATPKAVFGALTDPNQMDKWISSAADVEPRKHGRYSYGWTEQVDGLEVDAGPTRILEFEPDHLLVHNWSWPGETQGTKVSWEIAQDGGSATVSLTHSGFGAGDKVEGYIQGWGAFLAKLKSMLEGKSFVERAAS